MYAKSCCNVNSVFSLLGIFPFQEYARSRVSLVMWLSQFSEDLWLKPPLVSGILTKACEPQDMFPRLLISSDFIGFIIYN